MQIKITVPDVFDFQLDDGDYFECKKPKAGQLYFDEEYNAFVKAVHDYSTYRICIVKKKKYTYDFPEFFKNGTRLLHYPSGWAFKSRALNKHMGQYIAFGKLAQFFQLSSPPEDAPIGTVITKGEK